MKKMKWIWLGLVVVLAFALTMSTGCKKQEVREQEEKPEVELPAGVAAAVEANFPGAQIDFVEVVDEAGITLYEIEFKDDAGEIEVATDGTIIDIVTIINAEDVPEAAAEVFRQAAEGATIKRYEKSEIWTEIKQEEGVGKLIKLDSPKYVYEAEIVKGTRTGEIEVDADGKIIEPLKWDTETPEEKKK
jgi:hypothetical protein